MNIAKITIILITGCAFPSCSVESSPQAVDQTNVSRNQVNVSTAQDSKPPPDAQLQSLLAEIAKEAKGKVGVYATVIETGETVSLIPNERFAMQSIVKVPIAMAVLRLVDDGKLRLDQIVGVEKSDMTTTNQRSPIRDVSPNGTEMTVEELLKAAVSESDGTASDVLQRLAGGAEGVQAYVHSVGVTEMKIKHSHREFGSDWSRQYENWVSPEATVKLLTLLWGASSASNAVRMRNAESNPALSRSSADLLLQFMTESNNPDNRILAMLPKGTVVAHKTGTGGTQDGVTSATHDAGIITLPNGNHIAIAVLIGDSIATPRQRADAIANLALVVFGKWSQPSKEAVKPANFNERHTLN